MGKKKASDSATDTAVLDPEDQVATEEIDEDLEGDGEQAEYQALYRRYRPHRFEDVFGQESTTDALRSLVVSDKVPHAFLFTGPRGCGKTTTARILAAALNCERIQAEYAMKPKDRVQNGEPCGECDSCIGVANGSQSLGVEELDMATNRSIDDIRSLIQRASFASSMTRRKVFILDEAHQLGKDAISAFLKTLEEPPSGVIFILATTDPEKLLATIKSRVVTYRFNLVPQKRMRKLVRNVADQAEIEISDEQIERVVSEGQGSPRDTLSVLERFVSGGDVVANDYSRPLTQALADGRADGLLMTIASAVTAGTDLRTVGENLISYWRDCLLALQAPDLLDVTDERFDQLHEDAELMKPSRLIQLMTLMSDTVYRMGMAGDPRAYMESQLLRFMVPALEDRSLTSIHQRLDDVLIAIEAIGLNRAGGAATTWPETDTPPASPKVRDAEPDEEEDDEPTPAKKDKKSKAKPEPEPDEDDEPDSDDEDDEDEDEAPARGRSRVAKDADDEDESDAEEEDDEGDAEDLSAETILERITDDAKKRLRLVLEDATILHDEFSDTKFALETDELPDAQYDELKALVRTHAGGRKLSLQER